MVCPGSRDSGSLRGSSVSHDYDYLVVGSGFGGSVSACRLTEKGYSVGVLEMGKRFGPKDYPKTNWSFRRFLWAPALRCFGIFRMTLLKDIFVLSGAGVGGGSLVYHFRACGASDRAVLFVSPALEVRARLAGPGGASGEGGPS